MARRDRCTAGGLGFGFLTGTGRHGPIARWPRRRVEATSSHEDYPATRACSRRESDPSSRAGTAPRPLSAAPRPTTSTCPRRRSMARGEAREGGGPAIGDWSGLAVRGRLRGRLLRFGGRTAQTAPGRNAASLGLARHDLEKRRAAAALTTPPLERLREENPHHQQDADRARARPESAASDVARRRLGETGASCPGPPGPRCGASRRGARRRRGTHDDADLGSSATDAAVADRAEGRRKTNHVALGPLEFAIRVGLQLLCRRPPLSNGFLVATSSARRGDAGP